MTNAHKIMIGLVVAFLVLLVIFPPFALILLALAYNYRGKIKAMLHKEPGSAKPGEEARPEPAFEFEPDLNRPTPSETRANATRAAQQQRFAHARNQEERYERPSPQTEGHSYSQPHNSGKDPWDLPPEKAPWER